MESIDTSAAILVEKFTLNGDRISNHSLITSVQPRVPKLMASLAKLMTVILVWDKIIKENINPDKVMIEVPVGLFKGSSKHYQFYRKGEKVPLLTLVQSALIASSNEAAYALACWHSSSEKYFVPQMIQKSHMLGLKRSHWTSCTGLERNAYTNVEDMSKLAKVFISQYATVAAYCKCSYFEYRGKKLSNTNKLMATRANVLGLKTGNLVGIGSNLINYWIKDDIHYISVVLGAENRGTCNKLSKQVMDDFTH